MGLNGRKQQPTPQCLGKEKKGPKSILNIVCRGQRTIISGFSLFAWAGVVEVMPREKRGISVCVYIFCGSRYVYLHTCLVLEYILTET